MPDRSKSNAKPVLVAGATGAIGSEVVQALLERGAPLRVFVRSKEKVAHLPAEVKRVEGCMEDREAIGRALRGVQAAFFVSPHDPAEERLAENFLGACEAAGVRLVFSGVHAGGRNRLVRLLHRFLFGLLLPHYRPKLRIGERVRTSRTRAVVLVPANYFQTDEICMAALLGGEYPLSLRQFPRVDARDVGEAAARALLDPTVPPGAYTLVGPASLTGEVVAANWTAALGHPVRYR
ncbi:MAG TPA: NmrA family NAD(P)-binding protein, partial [Thermoanaerobaculia bacterium]|nr:NmrA family NAD(P)-binding protein [Thermoanaerobaculia bacterium]